MRDAIRVLDLIRAGRMSEAHELVQNDPSSEGSYLHGVIHREEGDLANARYWFARSGPIATRLGVDPMNVEGDVERAALARLFEA